MTHILITGEKKGGKKGEKRLQGFPLAAGTDELRWR